MDVVRAIKRLQGRGSSSPLQFRSSRFAGSSEVSSAKSLQGIAAGWAAAGDSSFVVDRRWSWRGASRCHRGPIPAPRCDGGRGRLWGDESILEVRTLPDQPAVFVKALVGCLFRQSRRLVPSASSICWNPSIGSSSANCWGVSRSCEVQAAYSVSVENARTW